MLGSSGYFTLTIRVSQKKQKSEFWYATYPTGFCYMVRWAAGTIFSIIDPLMTFCKSFLVLQCNYNREISQNFNLVVTDQSHSANFRPIALKRIEPRVLISEPLFYSIQSDRTQIGGVTLICYTKIALRQILKWPPVTQP